MRPDMSGAFRQNDVSGTAHPPSAASASTIWSATVAIYPPVCSVWEQPSRSVTGDLRRVLAEQLGDHCGVEVGAHFDDDVIMEPGNPAIMVVKAHPISRRCVGDELDHRNVPCGDQVGDVQLRTIKE